MIDNAVVLTIYDIRSDNPLNSVSNSGIFTCLAGGEIRVVGAATGGAVFGGSAPTSTFTVNLISSFFTPDDQLMP